MNNKIIVSFIVVMILIITLGGLSILKIIKMSDQTLLLYKHPFKVTNATKQIRIHFLSMHRYMKDIPLAKNEDDILKIVVKVNNSEQKIYNHFQTVFEFYLGDKKDIISSYEIFTSWKPVREEVISLMRAGYAQEASDIVQTKGASYVENIDLHILKLIDFANNKAKDFIEQSQATKNETIVIITTFVSSLIIITLFIMFTLIKQLKKNNIQMKNQFRILEQQSKLASMGEMIGAIAHQWRQPLNELGIRIQNLKYDYKQKKIDEEFLQDFISKNKKTINFMSKTIDDFRNFFRTDKEKNNFSIRHAIEEVINIQSSQLKNNNIILDMSGNDFTITSLKSELQQVLINIINNSKDALIENKIVSPQITIKLLNSTIVIEDNGLGMEESVLSRVFEPYFTTKDQGSGTGMGLYISKMIIENNMNGKLFAKNGKNGAIFIIDFSLGNKI